jgi:hypothetical protein
MDNGEGVDIVGNSDEKGMESEQVGFARDVTQPNPTAAFHVKLLLLDTLRMGLQGGRPVAAEAE